MTSASAFARIALAVLALVAPGTVGALGPCDKNHFILAESCGWQWKAINDGLTDRDVRVVAVDPVEPTTLYAVDARGLFKSVDGGKRWELTGLDMWIRNAPGDFVRHVVIDPRQPNVLYAATNWTRSAWHGQRRLLKSEDGGATWTDSVSPRINGVDQVNALVLAPSDPSTLYLANFDGFMGDTWSPMVRSDDAGESWSYLGFPVVNVLAVDPRDARTVYAGTFDFEPYFTDLPNGVLKSSDGGATWVATGLTGSGITALAVDPGDPDTLYAATGDAGTSDSTWGNGIKRLHKSIDGGASWVRLDNGLPAAMTAVTAIVIDPGDSDNVYVATAGSGVAASADGGATWIPLNDGLPCLFIHSLALVPGEPNALFAGTSCGVFKGVDENARAWRRRPEAGGEAETTRRASGAGSR